jgi:hypothetical protein
VIWLQCEYDDDDIMLPKSLSVKDTIATSAANLAMSAFLLLCREQLPTQVIPSVGIQMYWTAHPTLRRCFTTMRNCWVRAGTRLPPHARQVTGDVFYRTIVEETLDYVAREMRGPKEGWCSTQDADSEGEEGKFFLWTPDEICGILGEEARALMAAYGVTLHGNFEDKNIRELVGDMEQRPALTEARRKLFEAREKMSILGGHSGSYPATAV